MGLVGRHGDDGEDGNPAAKFFFAEERNRFADAVNFAADGDEPGIEIAEKFVDESGIGFEKLLDGVVIEIGRSDEVEEAEAVELVARDFAGAERGGLAEEISLEKGVAEGAGFEEIVVGFDFFGEQAHAVGSRRRMDRVCCDGDWRWRRASADRSRGSRP